MASSYAYLLKKANEAYAREERKRAAKETGEKAILRAELDAMVARGELYQAPDGRYGLPEWQTQS